MFKEVFNLKSITGIFSITKKVQMWRHQELATSGFNRKAPPLHAQPGTLDKHPDVAKSILDKEVAAVSDRVKVAPPQLILPPPP